MLSFDQNQRCFLVNGRPPEFTSTELEQMDSWRWWHQIPFGPDVCSKGFSNATRHISDYLLDTIDFTGKSVLDIGAWDGFQLFYAESQGASRVVGVDDLTQRPWGTEARDFSKRKLQSNAEFIDANVYDLSPEFIGTFDIVMMFGVLYHLIHPMLGIERSCSVAKQEYLLGTHYITTDHPHPVCFLYPQGELENDESNWSGPNLAWIAHALAIHGFEIQRDTFPTDTHVTVYATRVSNKFTQNKLLNSHRDTTLLEE